MKIMDEENLDIMEDARDFELTRVHVDDQTEIHRLADKLAETYECVTPYEQLMLLNVDLFG